MVEEMATSSELLSNQPAGDKPTDAPQEQHRPIMSVDRTDNAEAHRHILLPVDDTEDSEVAIEWAIKHVFKKGDIFHLLHVVPEPTMVHIWGGVYVPPDESAELQEIEDTKSMVTHRFAQQLVAAKVPFKLHVIVGPTDTDSISKVVAAKAEAVEAELVVVACHSKGRLKEFFVGSVTTGILARSKVPVIVVPQPQ